MKNYQLKRTLLVAVVFASVLSFKNNITKKDSTPVNSSSTELNYVFDEAKVLEITSSIIFNPSNGVTEIKVGENTL